MGEEWTKADLEARIKDKQDGTKDRVEVSHSRHSVVYRLKLESGQTVYGKSYLGGMGRSSLTLAAESFPVDPGEEWEKEATLYEFMGQTGVSPRLVARVPDEMMLVVEEAIGFPYSQRFLSTMNQFRAGECDRTVYNNRMSRLRYRMLGRLAHFYCQTQGLNDSFAGKLAARGECQEERDISRFVRGEEDRTRVEGYFLKLVYALSPEFRGENLHFYRPTVPVDPSERETLWSRVEEKVKEYVSQKGIQFDTFVSEFMTLYYRLLFGLENVDDQTRGTLINDGKMRLIHGDFGPHNVMYLKHQNGKIFDLNDVHFGPPQKDVSSAIFNLYCDTGESYVPSLVIYGLWEKVPTIKKAYPNPVDFLVGCIASRLLWDIRISASNSDYSDDEIERFTRNHPDFKHLGKEDKRNRFREDRIADIRDMLPFYAFGPGMNEVLAGATQESREALREILVRVKDFFSRTYIDSAAEQRYRGIDVSELAGKAASGK